MKTWTEENLSRDDADDLFNTMNISQPDEDSSHFNEKKSVGEFSLIVLLWQEKNIQQNRTPPIYRRSVTWLTVYKLTVYKDDQWLYINNVIY